MGCSGRFELITHPQPNDQPLPPQSSVSMRVSVCGWILIWKLALPFLQIWKGLPSNIFHLPIYLSKLSFYSRSHLPTYPCPSDPQRPAIKFRGKVENYPISPAHYIPYVFLSFFYLQLPHGLPPTSVSLETEVEKRFLRDPAWLPIHDTDAAFHRFLK